MCNRIGFLRSVTIAAILFFFFVFSGPAFAFQGNMGFRLLLPEKEKSASDLYLFGWNVNVKGEVDGDLFVLGGVVHVEGPVHGNVYLAGGRVEVEAPVTGSINIIALSAETKSDCSASRILALDGFQEGKVRGDLLAFGLLVDAKGEIKGDTLIGGDQATIGGVHFGRLFCVASDVDITGKIMGDADIKANSISVTSTAALAGNIVYTSPNELEGDTNSVKGSVTHLYPPPRVLGVFHFPWLYTVVHKMLSAVWLTVMGLFAVTTWLKRPSRSIIDAMLDYPWESFGTGLLICVAVPGISLILIVSILGFPLGFIMLSLFAIGVYMTRLFASLYIGERVLQVLEHHRPPYWQSLPIGVFIFTLLTSIPFVGKVLSLITIPLAFGGKFVAGRQFYKENAPLPFPD